MTGLQPRVFTLPLLLLCLATPQSVAMAQQRAPVPDAAAQAAARQVAADVYRQRFLEAKSDSQKAALAQEMLEAAWKAPEGSVDQYVLLSIGGDVAAGAGDVETALDAAERLGQQFEIDAAGRKQESLATVARNASTSTQQKAVAEAAAALAEELSGADQYPAAIAAFELAESAANHSRQYKMAAQVAARIGELKEQRVAFDTYQKAQAALAENPTDPQANLDAGRFFCIFKGDWAAGISMLALGSDPQLKALAVEDMKGAATADQQVQLGDQWWTLAESREGPEKDALRLRAGFWYRSARPQVSGGLDKAKIDKRLSEIATIRRPNPGGDDAWHSELQPLRGAWVDMLDGLQLKRKRLAGNWTLDGRNLVLKGQGRTAIGLASPGDYDLEIELTRMEGNDATYVVLPVGMTVCNVVLNSWRNTVCGLACVDHRSANANPTKTAAVPIVNGRKHVLTIRVRPEGETATIEVYFDGRRHLRWSGEQTLLLPLMATPEPGDVGVAALQSTTFHSIKIRRGGTATRVDADAWARARSKDGSLPPVPRVSVVRASYGSRNVTRLLQWLVARDPYAPVQADNWLIGDPSPGWRKQFSVTYRVGDEQKSLSLQEWSTGTVPAVPREGLPVPGASREFKVLAGRYGEGLHWADVTDAVREAVSDPTKEIEFTAAQAGPDRPRGKNVAVWFDYQGRRYVRIFKAGKTTLLP